MNCFCLLVKQAILFDRPLTAEPLERGESIFKRSPEKPKLFCFLAESASFCVDIVSGQRSPAFVLYPEKALLLLFVLSAYLKATAGVPMLVLSFSHLCSFMRPLEEDTGVGLSSNLRFMFCDG